MNNLTTRNQDQNAGAVQAGNGERAQQSAPERFVTPRATVVDTTDAVILELEMPGVAKDAISVTIDRDELTVTGSRKQEEYANAEILHQERPTWNFRRSFVLSECIDGSRTSAGYENGVLRLTLPKCEDAKPRKIEIQ